MSYAIKLNGFYYAGQNCQGLAVYCTTAAEAKHYYDRKDAEADSDKGEITLVPMWAL